MSHCIALHCAVLHLGLHRIVLHCVGVVLRWGCVGVSIAFGLHWCQCRIESASVLVLCCLHCVVLHQGCAALCCIVQC